MIPINAATATDNWTSIFGFTSAFPAYIAFGVKFSTPSPRLPFAVWRAQAENYADACSHKADIVLAKERAVSRLRWRLGQVAGDRSSQMLKQLG
jgi:hypothetical protein